MAKAWRIIISIVIIFAILGIVLVGVGIFTGADFDRLYQSVAGKYNLVGDYREYISYVSTVIGQLVSAVKISF